MIMELPLGKHFEGDPSEPCNFIVRASLGIDHDSEPITGNRRSIFTDTPILCYEIDVRFEVLRGVGSLDYFDEEGRCIDSVPLDKGVRGVIKAGAKLKYVAINGLITVLESDNGEVEPILDADI